MNIKKFLIPLLFVFYICILIPQALAAPKDDISSLYNDDGTFYGYNLRGKNYIINPPYPASKPYLTIGKYFTSKGVNYIICFNFTESIPDPIIRGEVLIGDTTYPLKKVLFKLPDTESEFSYLQKDYLYTPNPSLFLIPEDVISKINSSFKNTKSFLVLQGLQKDIIYHIPLNTTNIMNGLPILEKLTPSDHEEYLKIDKEGSGDPENPTILIKKF